MVGVCCIVWVCSKGECVYIYRCVGACVCVCAREEVITGRYVDYYLIPYSGKFSRVLIFVKSKI